MKKLRLLGIVVTGLRDFKIAREFVYSISLFVLTYFYDYSDPFLSRSLRSECTS